MAEMSAKRVLKEIYRVVKFICSPEFWKMAVLWTLSLLFSHLQLLVQRLSSREPNTYPRSKPQSLTMFGDQRPVCIITGATSGLGAAAAHALSKQGFFVVLVGRSSHLLSKTISEIRKQNTIAYLEAFEVDLSSFSSIMKFKASFQQWLSDMNMHSSVQLLINNAGILATSHRITTDGLDEMMMTNYMGAFCITKILLPLLINSPVPSRIVNVSSFTHWNMNDMQVDKEFLYGKNCSKLMWYPSAHIYEYTKLCLLIFSYELHRQFSVMDRASRLSVNAADPGAVQTNIMREVPSSLSKLAFAVLKILGLLHCPENGVNSILDAALAPPGSSGLYFCGGKGRTMKSSALSYDKSLGEKLWTISNDLFLELKLASMDISTLQFGTDDN